MKRFLILVFTALAFTASRPEPTTSGSGCSEVLIPEAIETQSFERKKEPGNRKDPCEMSDTNIERAIKAVLSNSAPARVTSAPWNGKDPIQRIDLLKSRFALKPNELAVMQKNGFVVPARLQFSTYATAFHEIYQSQMPLYVSIDSILHAMYISNDSLIKSIETQTLEPLLASTLSKMHCEIIRAKYPDEIARDVDLYMTVARSLLLGKEIKGELGPLPQVKEILEKANQASGMQEIEIFGRKRIIDFSQFQPRGHYDSMKNYFRAAMWLSRFELNLVSRSSRSSQPGNTPNPEETPREVRLALGLADLAFRAGVIDDINRMDLAWAFLAGRREDISIAQLTVLRKKAGIQNLSDTQADAKLRSAIGSDFKRTVRMHYMPEGSKELPAITTFLGPRIVPDSQALMPIIHSETPNRHMVHVSDAAYTLGNDRAKSYINDLREFPELEGNLEKARNGMKIESGRDLYSSWLNAIQKLNAPLAGTLPTFMKSSAFQDMRLNSNVAAFAQIRHNYVLLAAQSYSEGGCEIPDAYVEPALATYDSLIAYADLGEKEVSRIDPKDTAGGQAYFKRLGRILRVLKTIATHQVEGRSLSPESLRFLSMIVEMEPETTGSPATFTGWYFDLFLNRVEALTDASLIADYFTSGNENKVAYAGVAAPRLGIFMIDTGGRPRAVIGPIARGYETQSSTEHRLNDEEATNAIKSDPWAKSYTIAAPGEPALRVRFQAMDTPLLEVESPDLKQVTVQILDHHRKPIETRTLTLLKGKASFTMPAKKAEKARAIHIEAGEYDTWDEIQWSGLNWQTASFKDPEEMKQ
ncbi:MAG: DUF3160 domain-containing protein [Spirochaetia bacterium]|nr:DUF3160 domain-containing protein [Spirochaetia bacterium]